MSKKVIIALVVFVVIVGGAFLATKIKSGDLNYKNEQIIAEAQTEKLFKDSDNDGLKDWEEGLWQTDPLNPDTNGDGLNDFDSIREGVNPIGKGLNDKLATSTLEKQVNPLIESDLTETDKFSRELFAKYVAAKQSGSFSTTTDYANFLIDYVQNRETGDVQIYKEEDFKKVAETKESIRAYGNNFGKIIAENAKKYPGNEVDIFESAMGNDDEKKLEELDNPIKRYGGIRDGLIAMDVPEGLLSIHAKIVNLLNIMIAGIENMKLALKDPVKSLAGVSLYPNGSGYFVAAIQELHNYFINNEVIFDKNEDGYKFTSGY